jgi:hypothetical protein
MLKVVIFGFIVLLRLAGSFLTRARSAPASPGHSRSHRVGQSRSHVVGRSCRTDARTYRSALCMVGASPVYGSAYRAYVVRPRMFVVLTCRAIVPMCGTSTILALRVRVLIVSMKNTCACTTRVILGNGAVRCTMHSRAVRYPSRYLRIYS